MALTRRTPRIGLALGSGSARGWAHLGVLQALRDAGVQPDVVCGTSIGALVGAAYVAGEQERFADWVRSLTVRDVWSFMDFNLSGGMLKGEKLINFWRRNFADFEIEAAPQPFAAVATDMHSGAEVWLRHGSIANAVRASIALPGLFTPVIHEGRVLVDGGIVNPVPASLARAMGADIVIAVDLNADLMQHAMRRHAAEAQAAGDTAADDDDPNWVGRLQQSLGWRKNGRHEVQEVMPMPSLLDVVMTSVNIMQVRITRSRMAGDPPEIVIAPRLAHLGLLDFHRGEEAIAAGYAAAQTALSGLADFGWKAGTAS